MKSSYRTHFVTAPSAQQYEEEIFGDGTFGGIVWSLETEFLEALLRSLKPDVRYLDFACGTGRILSTLEEHVTQSTGIEISSAMLDVAQQKVKRSMLLCRDISSPNSPVEGQYDLITAFRFFLHAEPALRAAAMRALAARLATKESLLVFNVHSIASSYRGGLAVADAIVSAATKRHRKVQVLSERRVRRLCKVAGLEIVRTYGYGALSRHTVRILGPQRALALEKRVAGSKLGSMIGTHRIYVAKRAG